MAAMAIDAPAVEPSALLVIEPAPDVSAPPLASPKPSNGLVRCKVVNCALLHNGQRFEEGDEAEFTEAEALGLSRVLVRVE